MNRDREPKVRIRLTIDVELAVDADLNNKWRKAGREFEHPSRLITLREALVSPSRRIEEADLTETSDN